MFTKLTPLVLAVTPLLSLPMAFADDGARAVKQWSGEDLRRVHTMYVAPAWAENHGKNFEPREYVRALKKAGAGTIEFYLKDHHGNAYFKTSVGNFDGRDLLAPLVEESHAQGMKFVAYYSVGWDNWAFHNHPEWRHPNAVDPKKPGFLSVDVQSGYLDYMLQQLKDIAAQPVDGWFLDVATGGLIYGNSTFESQRKVYNTIKKLRPDSLVEWNGSGIDREIADDVSDVSSSESWRPEEGGVEARYLRRLKRPFTLETPGSYLGWAAWTPKPYLLLQVEGAVASANGGALAAGLNPLADGTVLPAEIDNLSKLWKFIAEREVYFVHTRSAADIGILLPENPGEQSVSKLANVFKVLVGRQIDFAVTEEHLDFEKYSLLVLPGDLQLSVGGRARIIRFVERGGKLLVLGNSMAGLEEPLGIETRGTIPYSIAYAALQAPQLRRNMIDYPVLIRGGSLRVKATKGTSLAKAVYPAAEYGLRSFFGEPAWSDPFQTGLSMNPPGEESDYDMIVRNRYGRGETLYMSGPLDKELAFEIERQDPVWPTQLLVNMIDLLLPDRLVTTDAPRGIEVVTNWQGEDRLIVSLINHNAGLTNRFALTEMQVPKAFGVKLWISAARFGRPARVVLEPGGRELKWTRKGESFEICVPEFVVHTFVVLERSSQH